MPDLNSPLERRRSDVTRVNTHGVKLHHYTVETLVNGTGEVFYDVPFPVLFVERPVFSCGLVLDDNQTVETGEYPTYSATVIYWDKLQKQGENVGYFYKGARVAVVVSGIDDQKAYMHTHFFGKALRNPTTGQRIDGAI